MNFAFYGLAAATGRRAARPVHADQLAAATTHVQRHGGVVVVIGGTRSTLTPYRYDELLWHCDNHDVQLWIPEIDGHIDPNSDHHRKIVNVLFWGLARAL